MIGSWAIENIKNKTQKKIIGIKCKKKEYETSEMIKNTKLQNKCKWGPWRREKRNILKNISPKLK